MTLQGEHVTLRAIERGDLEQLLAWRNDPALRQYFREHRELTMEDQNSWYENVVLAAQNTLMFSIVEREGGRLLGAAGLVWIDWVNKNADISLYIGADDIYVDDTLAPDVARLLLEYGFGEQGLHRIWAEVYDFDTAKQKLFNDLGFTQDGRHRETYWHENEWHDSIFYGLLADEFASS